ncbi:MAG: phosphate acetyltransferase [Proteobacteria bacterium]|nr:MAG: phosphate acetyltransferase [Pseudomonadota bacterium]
MKTKSLYIANKNYVDDSIYGGFISLLKQKFDKVCIFCPIGDKKDNPNTLFTIKETKDFLLQHNRIKFFQEIIKAFKKLEKENDFVLCEGVDIRLFGVNFNFDINLEIAKNLSIAYGNILKDCDDILNNITIESNSVKASGCAHFASFVINANREKFSSLKLPAPILTNFKDALDLFDKKYPTPITPSMFEHTLFEKAKQDVKTIVLPESEDDRILQACHEILEEKVANIILLGKENKVKQRAKKLGLNLDQARIIDPENSPLVETFADIFYELRKHKGVNKEEALNIVKNPTYFATMMVYDGDAHGMVSGAVNTTADTIRPALQIIKTKPETSIVSSVFFMCLHKNVYVFGDCAINPEPTPEQLGQIAVTSAKTAKAFGMDPKVAMLSYSTGDSGQGEAVKDVKKALIFAKNTDKHLKIDGPIQFDAAIDRRVAIKKMPNSKIAGKENVFIFPDLNSGNIAYKAVQRTTDAIAIGPILQGLKKPINDLSRGCLVDDIVNTIAITAIQAQGK